MWDDAASRALVEAVRVMRAQAGQPSLRDIAERVSATSLGTLSHNTVASLLRGEAIPSWPHVQAIVTALGGDPATVREQWQAAQLHRQANTGRRWDYMQLACPFTSVAKVYTEHDARGWQPLHAFVSPTEPGSVHLVMRRPV